MKKIRILFIAAVLIAVLIPAAASAAGVFYCSALRSTGGVGTWANPWACANNTQVSNLIDQICIQNQGGHLFRIFANSYVHYRIEWGGVQSRCTVTSTEYPGYPPNSGVDLPLPLMLGIGASVGILLVGAGMMLRRKSSQS